MSEMLCIMPYDISGSDIHSTFQDQRIYLLMQLSSQKLIS